MTQKIQYPYDLCFDSEKESFYSEEYSKEKNQIFMERAVEDCYGGSDRIPFFSTIADVYRLFGKLNQRRIFRKSDSSNHEVEPSPKRRIKIQEGRSLTHKLTHFSNFNGPKPKR